MLIQTKRTANNGGKGVQIWEGDGYDDEPYGEAIATLLTHDPHLERVLKVIVYTETGVLEHVRFEGDAS